MPEVKKLVGKLLTQVEAMGLTENAERANKDLIGQMVWQWYTTYGGPRK